MIVNDFQAFRQAFEEADALVLGAGSGLSFAAGMDFSGARFEENFSDMKAAYGIEDMYRGSFYPFPDEASYWAYFSRVVALNRYDLDALPLYKQIVNFLEASNKDYFVITTNVDHQFQKAGIDPERFFYTQGDYGSFQCAKPCHKEVYDNQEAIEAMVAAQKDLRIPESLIPTCPVCQGPMRMHLRDDHRFVQNTRWQQAQHRYERFLDTYRAEGPLLFLEIGVGNNTPAIIKYPFWHMTYLTEDAHYAIVNAGDIWVPKEIKDKSYGFKMDIQIFFNKLEEVLG